MGLIERSTVACVCVVATLALPGSALAGPRPLYATNYVSAGTVSAFTIRAGGVLSANGAPISSGDVNPWYMAMTPDGKYLYVGNNGDFSGTNGNTIAQYSVNSNGKLSALSPATVTINPMNGLAGGAPAYPFAIAVSPNGKQLYVTEYNFPHAVAIFDIAGNGTLSVHSGQPYVTNLTNPAGIAVSPNGKSLYAVLDNNGGGPVEEFDIGTDGNLTPKPTPSVDAGNFPDYIVLTPNGRYAYVANNPGGSDSISQYQVGSGAQLKPFGGPVSVGTAGDLWGLTISPHGTTLYAPDGSNVYQFSIGSTGRLTPIGAVPSGAGAQWLSMTANGKNAYTANYGAGSITEYHVGSDGALSETAGSPLTGVTAAGALIIPPDQGPVASFTSTLANAGSPSTFDGSGSHDPDGKVAGYAWSFGDGTNANTTTAMVTHTYTNSGKYTVTLTVTDGSGCSTALVFTGTTAYCNGTRAAQMKRAITIP